jgi:type III pantothenate kinase
MLLAIDIGNSTTKFGLYDEEGLTDKITILTGPDQTAASIFEDVGDRLPATLDGIFISSVVKEVNKSYIDFGSVYFGISPFFLDHTFDFGFSINYFPPEDCGADRLADALAAVHKYGAPCIVCDFGTATTIDIVSENNVYLGGIITPGIDTLASALFEKTSKLPKVTIMRPDQFVGNSTISSIQSGIYYGYIGLVDGIIERMIGESDYKPAIVSTGGFAGLISEESKYVEIVDSNLMLDGLRLAYSGWQPKE